MSKLQELLNRLKKVKKCGDGYQAQCPAHDDKRPSLSLKEVDGKVLMRCHAGCSNESIMASIGMTMSDLMPQDEAWYPLATHKNRNVSTCRRSSGHTTLAGAMEYFVQKYGPSTAIYIYEDVVENEVAAVTRWDIDGGKEIRPFRKTGEYWESGFVEGPRPLFNLPQVLRSKRVCVVEGEKAAEAMIEIGFTATTSIGGSVAAKKTDWSQLAGKEVFVFPDNDSPGEKYASDVVQKLQQFHKQPKVKIVRLPNLAEKGDCADFINSFGDKLDNCILEIKVAMKEAELVPVDPIVLEEKRSPFPIESLPTVLKEFVVAHVESMGCPVEYLLLPMLGTLAAAIGNTFKVEVRPGWIEACIIWTLLVGRSGTMKSIGQSKAVSPLERLQSTAYVEHKDEMLNYEVELDEWKSANAKKKKNAAIERVPEPKKPTLKRMVASDATMEALGIILSENPRGILLNRDEGTGWFESLNQYKSGGDDSSKLLELFRGEPLTIDRVTRGTLRVNSPFVSFAGTIQPSSLRRVMSKKNRSNGTAQRFLIAFPESQPKSWSTSNPSEECVQRYVDLLENLLDIPLLLDDRGEPISAKLKLSAQAVGLYSTWYDKHNLDAQVLDDDLSSAWSKLEAYVPRLALLFTIVEYVEDLPMLEEIDVKNMQQAIDIVEWFKAEYAYIYEFMDSDEETDSLLELVRLIRSRGGTMSTRELMRASRRYGKTVAETDAWLEALVEQGYARWSREKKGTGPAVRSATVIFDSDDAQDGDKEVA